MLERLRPLPASHPRCERTLADRLHLFPCGRLGLVFRMQLVGYFEGLDSERGIAWRCADSLSLREFLGTGLTGSVPDYSTVSRTRRRIDLETHGEVFSWMLRWLAGAGLIDGKTIGVDASTLEANAAMRSIVRRENGETYNDFLPRLASVAGTWLADATLKPDREPASRGLAQALHLQECR